MGKTRSHNKRRYEAGWALFSSLSLHTLLVLVLGTTSSFDLTVGKETRFDIFWLSPSSAPTSAAASVEAASQPSQNALQRQAVKSEEVQPEKAALPGSAATPPRPDSAKPEHFATRHPDHAAGKKPPIGMTIAIAAARKVTAPPARSKRAVVALQAVQQKEPSAEAEAPDTGAPIQRTALVTDEDLHPTIKRQTGNKALQSQQSPRMVPGTEKTDQAPEQLQGLEPGTLRLEDQHAEQQRMAKEADLPVENREPPRSVALERPLSPAPAAAKLTPASSRQETRQTTKASAIPVDGRVKVPAGRPLTLPEVPAGPAAKENKKAKPSEKPPETRGIVITSLHGDLKMVIAGDSGIKLFVVFREYPRSRRNKVLSRSEARREQRIIPVFVKTRQETREAVIETAREGIYVFSAESDKGEAAKATFTLKIFETDTREKVTAIGTRAVSRKAVLTKVLMPDAILWDDDSAFTGSLEDSDSTTKFNAQTGLYWKEYND